MKDFESGDELVHLSQVLMLQQSRKQNLLSSSSGFIIQSSLWSKKDKHGQRWKQNQDSRILVIHPTPSIRQMSQGNVSNLVILLTMHAYTLWWEQALHEVFCCRHYWGQPAACGGSLASLTWRAYRFWCSSRRLWNCQCGNVTTRSLRITSTPCN